MKVEPAKAEKRDNDRDDKGNVKRKTVLGNGLSVAPVNIGPNTNKVVYGTEKQFYVGGEQVYRVDLFVDEHGQQDYVLTAVTHTARNPVYDVYTGAPVYGWDGQQLLHDIGDPVLHFAGEPVLHHAAEIRRFLGGRLDPSNLQPTG